MLLEWQASDEAAMFEVEHARSENFHGARVFYQGAFPSAHVSGLRNGEHVFRVRAQDEHGDWSGWSEPMHLTVAHHSMALVWPLFGLGAAVFFCTLGFVVFQVRNQEGES
jgi:hypothetical protein